MTNPIASFISEARELKPLQAWRSVRALIANPESTGEVFKIIEALKGDSLNRALTRFTADAHGRAILREKPDILAVLSDRDALRAMPADSLGRAYLQFVEARDLSADGLVAASEEAPRDRVLDADARWLANRLRDIHDLQHVICGYGSDELGELCLLAFMTAQTPNRGISFIIFMGRRQFRQTVPQIDIDACVAEGKTTGETARWFAMEKWEARFAEPLEQLRAEFNVQPPTLYREALATLSGDSSAVGQLASGK